MMINRIDGAYPVEPVHRITRKKRVKHADNLIKSEAVKTYAEIKDERLGKYVDITIDGPIFEKNKYSYWI